MKKMIWFLIGLMMVASVFAAGNQQQTQMQVQEQVNVQGLNRVQAQVQTQTQLQTMEQAMSRIRTQERERLNQLNNCVATLDEDSGDVTVVGTQERRFLGLFRFQKWFTYRITEQGEVEYQARWHDFLWSE